MAHSQTSQKVRYFSFCKSSFTKNDCLAILPLKNCKVEGLKKIYGTFFCFYRRQSMRKDNAPVTKEMGRGRERGNDNARKVKFQTVHLLLTNTVLPIITGSPYGIQESIK